MYMPRLYPIIVLIALFLPGSITGQYAPPAITWQKCLGGSGYEKAADVLLLPDGGYLIAGETSSADGDVTGHYGTASTSDGWLVRLSASGNIIWQKNIGGSGHEQLKTIRATSDGNFVAVGTTTSNDNDVTGNHGGQDIWVVKFSSTGNLIWNKCYGGSGKDTAGSILQHPDGGYIIVGSTNSGDGQLSGTRRATDVWYFKINATGDLQWGHVMGNLEYDYGEDIRLLPDNNILFSVEAGAHNANVATSDFPMDPNVLSTLHPWIVKIDHAGNIIWKNRVGPANYFNFRMTEHTAGLQISSYGITLMNQGSHTGGMAPPPHRDFAVHLADYNGTSISSKRSGIFSADYNESLQIIPLSPNGSVALPDSMLLVAGTWRFLYQPDTSRALIIKKSFKSGISQDNQPGYYGGSRDDAFVSIKQLTVNKFIAVGYTFSNDGDVSGNHGGGDMWIVQLTDSNLVKKNTIRGLTFIDNNNNGRYDAGDELYDQLTVNSVRQSDGAQTGTLPNSGIYFNEVDTGTYKTSVSLARSYYTVSPAEDVSVFTDYFNNDTILFALKPVPGIKDYSVDIFPVTPARMGFDITYHVKYSNIGTDTMNNTTVEMIKDSLQQFISSVPAHDHVNGDTIRWVLNNVLPASSGLIEVKMNTLIDSTILGDTVIISVGIDSTNDVYPGDNSSVLNLPITGSWDPNDKQENHQGILRRNVFESGQYLTYRIRFQNTGTDTAFKVVIRDTLSSDLDWQSLQMVAASHSYKFDITDSNKLAWTFKNILLPDSNVNEPASHGYIVYRIMPRSVIQVGDTISNRASIYFDFNQPVHTNTQETVLLPVFPPVPAISGVSNSYCAGAGMQKVQITNLPQAADGITVTASLDGNALLIGADSTLQFDVTGVDTGKHVIAIHYDNGWEATSYQFDIDIEEAATPEVDVTASVTNITTLVDSVVITAVNLAGGGSAPLYTFALDRNFAQVIRAENTSVHCKIEPASLTIGNNWIYVRMKTSETCYTSQTGVDSIKITRDATTGIVDVDYPGQVISIYPNPFNGPITISGLSTTKKYTVILYNLRGQQLSSTRIYNTNTATINGSPYSAGSYWLGIYDEKRKRLLGTVKLVKQ